MIGASNVAALNAMVRPFLLCQPANPKLISICDTSSTCAHLELPITMLQACSGTAAADPLAPLNVKVDPDDACQRSTGVSAALSDLLHFGMVTMRARAQQGCQAACSTIGNNAGGALVCWQEGMLLHHGVASTRLC